MPVFPKPKITPPVNVAAEVAALRQHKQVRGMPAKPAQGILLGTWNIANLGAQKRDREHHQILAEILGWFDVVAVQECRDNFGPLFDILQYMGPRYKTVMSDASGNDERMVMIYDSQKLTLLEEVGEIAFPVTDLKNVKLKGITQKFAGFDRSPYLTSFKLDDKLSILVINVHLYFGNAQKKAIERRALETAGVARWAAKRRKSQYSFAREVVAIGDFNMPKPKKDGGSVVYDALTSQGLVVPAHTSEIGSSIATDNHYDQVAYFPSTSKNCVVDWGVFDYDKVAFSGLWHATDKKKQKTFYAYLRYYMSDHRPMWVRLRMQ